MADKNQDQQQGNEMDSERSDKDSAQPVQLEPDQQPGGQKPGQPGGQKPGQQGGQQPGGQKPGQQPGGQKPGQQGGQKV